METTDINKIKQKVQTTIVTCSVLLLIAKFIAYFLTNSVGVLTDAMESIVNVTAGFISLYAIYKSSKPRDYGHLLGHGKIELISASVEGILIIIAGTIIIYEGIQRLFTPSEIQKLDIGIIVVAAAGIINYLLGWYSIQQGKKHGSIALIAGGKHLQSDTYSTIGLVTGLLLLYFTGKAWIDSALAIVFGSIIGFTGINILRNTINNLIDTTDDETLSKLSDAINKNRNEEWINIHNLKMIKSGNDHFINCDLTMPWFYNINQSHTLCDDLKEVLKPLLSNASIISIHSDPCKEKYCTWCKINTCDYRKKAFTHLPEISKESLVMSEDEMNIQ